MPALRLSNRVAIVTGASSGLGRAIALAYAAAGARVVCADLRPTSRDPGDTITTHEAITHGKGEAHYVECDVSDSSAVQALIKEAIERYGRLDIIVNNAGISLEADERHGAVPIQDVDESVFDQTMSVNTRSVFLGCKYAIRQFLAQKPLTPEHRGWIVNTCSIYGLVGASGYGMPVQRVEWAFTTLIAGITVSYNTSKGAIAQLTRSVAIEQAPFKIHCNAICPGFIPTSMDAQSLSDPSWRDAVVAQHPWGSLGRPQSIAKAALFLGSEEADWVTGVLLPVDGGFLAQ